MAEQSLGEIWLRGKLKAYDASEFHRVDPPLLRAAISDLLRALDELRFDLADARFWEDYCG